MLAARRARGDAVVDERALGRRVPREPHQGRSVWPAASPNGKPRRRRPRRRPSVMWRRSSVVHVVDELLRAQRRERHAGRTRGAARRARVGAVERPRRAASLGARARSDCSAWLGGVLGWVVAAAARRGRAGDSPHARRAMLGLLHAMQRSAGVGAGDDRLGRRGWSVPVPGRVVGRSRARRRRAATCGCVEGSRSAIWTLAASISAACLRAREVRVLRDPRDAARASVLIDRRDPFEDAAPMSWPAADADALSLWEPIPLGVDEQGEQVAIELVERNVLIGGEPGAGKSVGALGRDRRGGARPRRADVAAGRQARRARGVGAGRSAGRRPERRGRARAAARGPRRDGRALSRAARARAAQGATRRRAAAAPGRLRRAGVLPDGAREGACSRSSPSCCATWWLAGGRPA